ncbi:tRNA (N6-isopentenyl adenosine(37)-C2)-methylthiotransferase MiaB [Vampirovibrio chlorellavorus]|uniref:tRNA (N6-isopentenyl adenosine(37)-C2)-methylthiotransferase MiaB n=1 Tax=Vampirovibrio chlorellavorus TaxID=758823 RepID=UPI0026F0A07F|nr:tRNA (N6-isopentenyl adenosine(37)-C2)-methylthiotransferase MiaB [Vampirovibrio chlorellavorus]
MTTTAPPRKVYLETLGCQMNFNDSEVMLGLLKTEGFERVENREQADLLIVNTCQIRGSAEDKAFSYLGAWGKLKARNPRIKIAMAGCVSQQNKETIFKRAPYVDIVFGTQNIHELPELVRKAFNGENNILAVDRQKPRSTYDYINDVAPVRESDISAWVTIIEGCDYFCTYCVVPYTRGRQISRSPESIIREVLNLAAHGFKEITLLGQTVDSYGKDFEDRQYGLAELLEELSEIAGIERIRFMTSHPLDLNDRIIQAVADLPKVMEYIHIPMQAGDDEILARMKRGYTAQQYYDLVHKIYDKVPNVAVSGDYIVGFPGETEAQFQRTVESVALSGIHNANTAAYSPRKQTPAAIWEARGEEIPEAVKEERLQILIAAIREQSFKMNRPYLNQTVEILVEGKSKRNPSRLTGRTRTNKVVNFDTPLSEDALVGQLVSVKITEALPFSLLGEMVGPDPLHVPDGMQTV